MGIDPCAAVDEIFCFVLGRAGILRDRCQSTYLARCCLLALSRLGVTSRMELNQYLRSCLLELVLDFWQEFMRG